MAWVSGGSNLVSLLQFWPPTSVAMGLPNFHQRDMHDIFSSFPLKKVSIFSHVTTAISEQPCNILYISSQFQVSDNDIRLEPGWAQHRLDAAPWLSCSQRWGHGGSWWTLDDSWLVDGGNGRHGKLIHEGFQWLSRLFAENMDSSKGGKSFPTSYGTAGSWEQGPAQSALFGPLHCAFVSFFGLFFWAKPCYSSQSSKIHLKSDIFVG